MVSFSRTRRSTFAPGRCCTMARGSRAGERGPKCGFRPGGDPQQRTRALAKRAGVRARKSEVLSETIARPTGRARVCAPPRPRAPTRRPAGHHPGKACVVDSATACQTISSPFKKVGTTVMTMTLRRLPSIRRAYRSSRLALVYPEPPHRLANPTVSPPIRLSLFHRPPSSSSSGG